MSPGMLLKQVFAFIAFMIVLNTGRAYDYIKGSWRAFCWLHLTNINFRKWNGPQLSNIYNLFLSLMEKRDL